VLETKWRPKSALERKVIHVSQKTCHDTASERLIYRMKIKGDVMVIFAFNMSLSCLRSLEFVLEDIAS